MEWARNNKPTGVGLMFVFKVQQLAQSRLRNYCCNQEDGHKDQREAKLFRARSYVRDAASKPTRMDLRHLLE